jgi:hypothetical protein
MAFGMSDEMQTRRLEVHFTTDDEALVVELDEDSDGHDVDELIDALDAVNVDDAEELLRQSAAGTRPIGRLGSHRRW